MADTKSREISVREENPGTDETGGAVKGVEVGAAEAGVADQSVMYPVDSVPPLHLTILFGLQQALMTLGGTMSLPFILASLFCPENESQVRAQLLSITMFMCGLATMLQCLLGVRLPIIQGGSHTFVAPIVAMLTLEQFRCPTEVDGFHGNASVHIPWERRMREVQGNLILASVTQVVVRGLGLVGLILRFVGPLTIAPTISLIGLSLTHVVSDFCGKHWGISLLTLALLLLFSNIINNVQLPVSTFTVKRKCHVTKFPIFQLFPVVITIAIVWLFCFVLTEADAFPTNSTEPAFRARTDSKVDILYQSSWFQFPLPLPFGMPTFSAARYMGMLAATLSSIFESVGDYFAAARFSEAPNPPAHAINRGIAIEGVCSIISGVMGAGHATTSYSGNIGIIGITKVGSRVVFVTAGAMLVFFGVLGKVGAVLALIPDPIVGGTLLLGLGMVASIGIAVLQFCEMFCTRNITIVGLSFLMGLMVPEWLVENKDLGNTGSEDLDQVIKVLFGTASFTGGFIGFLLDNIVPGTEHERGIKRWIEVQNPASKSDDSRVYSSPPLTRLLERVGCCRYCPVSPTFKTGRLQQGSDTDEIENEGADLEEVKVSV
uniref:Solute carrier family 23 member 2-like isoform X1 n=1 Tax=Crassostrea virginica TaxID=6565 RepID=A0A8B8AF31_CRAVI|nr:solute carrier family 23 member 2-like isoform X1 [Crassostrea virginica]